MKQEQICMTILDVHKTTVRVESTAKIDAQKVSAQGVADNQCEWPDWSLTGPRHLRSNLWFKTP